MGFGGKSELAEVEIWKRYIVEKRADYNRFISMFWHILTTNLAAVVCVCVCAQKLTNFCPHALISNPYVPKILFA